ncbi:MAG: hypothetical protein OEY73_06170, partial [Hadesarchaea archaeon]|nr:hypothetical protein [Hadesarchaea archaeon]
MREKLALAIAALMITSMAFAISTTSVSATHATPTISLSPDFVKEGESYVFTLSVTNESGDPIDTVEITPSHLTNIESIVKLPKDNIVENANVALSDGTQVTVVSASVTVAENTVVSLPAGTLIVAPSGDDAELYEDGTAEMIASENSIATVSAVKAAADRLAAKQNPDGGFMWKLQVGGTSRTNVLGITAIGILKAHGLEDKDTYETALAKAYKYAVDKPPTYTWGGSKYTESTKGVDS